MSSILPKISPMKQWFFTKYTRFLLHRRFEKVLVRNTYNPKTDATSLFFGNHSYWWDALIPLSLNDVFFQQQLRAIMERKQTETWPFFLEIGAIPVEFGSIRDGRNLIASCHKVLAEPNNALWLFPEGTFYNLRDSPGPYQPLIASLANNFPLVDIVCVTQYIDFQKSSKPLLYIDIQKANIDSAESRKEILQKLHKLNADILTELIDSQLDKTNFIDLY